MPRAQVGRPPAGDVAKAESETARRAYVAARLEQEANQEYLETLGVAINRTALTRAGAPLLWRRRGYRPRGRRPNAQTSQPVSRTAQSHATPGTFREWLTVDPKPLNLIMELVTLISKTRASQMKAASALAAIRRRSPAARRSE